MEINFAQEPIHTKVLLTYMDKHKPDVMTLLANVTFAYIFHGVCADMMSEEDAAILLDDFSHEIMDNLTKALKHRNQVANQLTT